MTKFKLDRTVDVFEFKRAHRNVGYERSSDHKDMINSLDKFIKLGFDVDYKETLSFPLTKATLKVRENDADTGEVQLRATSKRTDKVVDNSVGSKRLREDDIRRNSAGGKAAADVGRQRRGKSRTSK